MNLVVVDFDDVLSDLNGSVEAKIKSMGYPSYSVNNILTYDLNKSVDTSLLPESQRDLEGNGLGCPRELILSCYSDASLFSSIYPYSIDSLARLTEKFDVMINTLCFNTDIMQCKLNLFKSEFKSLNLIYNTVVGKSKPVIDDAYAVFDDNISVLIEYPVTSKKILVDKPWNREVFNQKSISKVKNMHRVKNFSEGVDYLLKEVWYFGF